VLAGSGLTSAELSEEGKELDLHDDVEGVGTGDRVKNNVLGLLGATSVGVKSVEEAGATDVRDADSTVFELAMTLLLKAGSIDCD